MNNTFIYEQGWLVEKPEMEKPNNFNPIYSPNRGGQSKLDTDLHIYKEHLATLRRFKYDYPDPGKEMELGKDFEVMINHLDQKEWRAIPITQRTYSEQDLLDKEKEIEMLRKEVEKWKDEYGAMERIISDYQSSETVLQGRLQSAKDIIFPYWKEKHSGVPYYRIRQEFELFISENNIGIEIK